MAQKRLASKKHATKYPRNPRDFLAYASGNILQYVGEPDHRVRFVEVADEPMMLRVSDDGKVVLVNRDLVQFVQRPRIHKAGRSKSLAVGAGRRRRHAIHTYRLGYKGL